MQSLRSIYQDYYSNKFANEFCTDWGSALIYRHPGMVLAWLLTATSATPNLITALGSVLLVVMILATAMTSPLAAFGTVMALAVVYQILDCTDGTLARAKGLSSIQGQYWDLVADVVYRGIAYTAVGYVCDQLSPWPGALSQATILALSAWLAVVARLARLNIERLTPPSAPAAQGPRFTAFSFLSGLDTVFPLLAVLAWATNSLNGFVLWIFIYSLGDVVSALQEARGKLHP